MNVLKKLYEEDIKDRKSRDWDKATKEELDWLDKRDKNRKHQVIALYKKKEIKSGLDYHHAALILQHGETPDDFKLANKFAEKAVASGDDSARWLYAATLDRWLLSEGKPQKFGTQVKMNKKGKWELGLPIDPNVTDEQRVRFNVPPLKEALKKFKQKYGITLPADAKIFET